ncbi:EAL domain-containing protein [Undibacterium sp. TJN19]|uniref:EAL domain-containing protein n=1 Tax=Undibacterium sp. TJN19 TaxID=3413055 RepID=UPI003BF01D71
MHYPALQNYLSRLHSSLASSNLWLDEQGRARGRYFNSTLSTAFQAIRSGDDERIVAYEAYARSYAADDQGLSIWKLLENAANDDESVELDRLCRLLHTLNFYRQPESVNLDLYLSVHSRLLAAVEGNHGMAFRRILDLLEVPHQQVVLQLPLISASQRWVLTHVAENYRRNGFRIGLHASSLEQASDMLERIRPSSIKVDISLANDAHAQVRLLEQAERGNCHIIFRRIENQKSLLNLRAANQTASPYLVQGFLFDLPRANLLNQQKRQPVLAYTY